MPPRLTISYDPLPYWDAHEAVLDSMPLSLQYDLRHDESIVWWDPDAPHEARALDADTLRAVGAVRTRAHVDHLQAIVDAAPIVTDPPRRPRAPAYPDDTILLWPYTEAPAQLATMSEHGGDEDWVCLVPWGMWHHVEWASWLDALGCASVSRRRWWDWVVCIGAHA